MSMNLQPTYTDKPAVAFPGQLLNGPSIKETARNAEAVASMPFGTPVAYKPTGATTEIDVTIPANATDKLKGITFRADGFSRAWTDDSGPQGDLDGTGVRAGRLLDFARSGTIRVPCQTGCAPGDRPFISFSAGATYTAPGQFGNVAEAGHTIDATSKGEWKSLTAPGELAVLEFDFLNK